MTAWTPQEEAILQANRDNSVASAKLRRAGFNRSPQACQKRRERIEHDNKASRLEENEQLEVEQESEIYVLPAPSAADEMDELIKQAVLSEPYTSVTDLCDLVDRGPSAVQAAVERLQQRGYRFAIDRFQQVHVPDPVKTGFVSIPLEHFYDGRWVRLGLVSDTHLCSVWERLDVLNAAYSFFEREGIREVLHCGNWIDGEARFNKGELLTPAGFEHQVRYFLENYPQVDGITTRILSGDDHEGWYQQREAIDVGKRMEQTAREMGREDIINLGYGEVDLPFYPSEDGTGTPIIARAVHPGGGSAYATSYAPQKLVESYSGGEKPQAVFIGHWHKSEMLWYRNTAIVQAGCMQDQSLFMRKKKLSAHVGYWLIEFQVSTAGEITRFRGEWFPFYNSGFYQNRYGLDETEQVA